MVDDNTQNIVSFIRRAADGEYVICVVNFSPVDRKKYVMGVPESGYFKAELTSALKKYGGAEERRPTFRASAKPAHGQPYSVKLNIPGNSVMFLKPVIKEEKQ